MIPTLSQLCSLNCPFEKNIEDYSAAHCHSIELWLTKLEDFLETHSLSDAANLLERAEVAANVASYQGGLLTSHGAARQAAWDLFERRLGLCADLRVRTLVVACDVVSPIGEPDIELLKASLREIACRAEARQVRIALEFQARSTIGNNLQTAIAFVDEIGSPWLGIDLDVFHFYVGPSKMSDMQWLTNDNLFHVQLSDLVGVPRELATDADRVVPGDGDFLLAPIVDHLQAIGYSGCVSMELMNPRLWNVPARQFGEIAITALRKLLGQADMGR
jgi:sugar phosphate isomerase/epimerase